MTDAITCGVSLDTVLQRAPELVVEIDASNNVTVHHEGSVYLFHHEALSLLEVFSHGLSVHQALQQLSPRLTSRGAVDSMLTCLTQMVHAGVLTEPGRSGFSTLTFPRGGYDAAYVHIRMLDDHTRKQAFLAAIHELVGPDDVVLDLGTGSGIHAVAAAQAGARQVYAVDPSNVISLAEQVAEANGVADRISFIRGWSTKVELPEQASVLISDILGNESLEMRVWETLHDAYRRLLVPNARLIPAGVRAQVCVVEADPDLLREYRPDRDHVRSWRDAYGIDFTPLASAAQARSFSFYVEPDRAADWVVLAEPIDLYDIDLTTEPGPFVVEGEATVTRAGCANAFLSLFHARLSPSVTLSTAPWDAGATSHWFSACWALPYPRAVQPGDRLAFRYEYRGDGHAVLSSPQEGAA